MSTLGESFKIAGLPSENVILWANHFSIPFEDLAKLQVIPRKHYSNDRDGQDPDVITVEMYQHGSSGRILMQSVAFPVRITSIVNQPLPRPRMVGRILDP